MGMKLKDYYTIDIETVSQGARSDAFTEAMTIKTGNTKDEEKLRAKVEEGRNKARSSHGLSWITGKIFCVSIVNCDTLGCESIVGFDEVVILERLRLCLDSTTTDSTRLFAKSGKDFDYPFMIGRYMANNMQLPRILRKPALLNDVDDLISFSKQSGQRGKLSDYAHGLGFNGKTMHGSQVQDVYNTAMLADSDEQEVILKSIVAYCEQDCLIATEIVRRFYGQDY